MNSREKYEIPDWVVDDYNSRVSEEDRLPLGDKIDNEEDGRTTCTNIGDENKSNSCYELDPSYKYLIGLTLFLMFLVIQFPAIGFLVIILMFLYFFLFK